MADSWALLSLTELIALVGDPEAEVDLESVVSRTAETLDAEVAILGGPTEISYVLGLGASADQSTEALIGIVNSHETVVDVPVVGSANVARSRIEGTQDQLVLARRVEPFAQDELAFVRAMGRVLGMSRRVSAALAAEREARRDLEQRVDDNRRLVGQLRERQDLLDRLFRIQRSISHRAPTQDVLDAVTVGALDLLGVARVSLRLRDNTAPDELVIVSSRGFSDDDLEEIRVATTSAGLAGRCVREERLIVGDDDMEATMAAPVHVNGEVVGCLTLSSTVGARRFSPPEQEALLGFAESASLALQDARAIDTMRSALNRERHRAEHDPLTGLANRATVQDHLQARLADIDSVPISVLFVDLDRFKFTNDTLGHAFGDEVLMVVSDRLQTSVRDHDVVGRLAGDEFVVVCEGISEFGAIELAERIQAVIGVPIGRGHAVHRTTVSVGIACAVPGDTAEQLIANADLAMYRAKQRGRARVEVFDREFREDLEERFSVGQDLRRAVDDGELVVHLQPVVALPERRVVSFEALARWQHPERGSASSRRFHPPGGGNRPHHGCGSSHH